MRHWDSLAKKQQKHIRDMAAVAYEREITAALDSLFAVFQDWKQGRITPFALDEKLHQYHDGIARELYKRYSGGKPDMAVLLALANGVLKVEELNEDCRALYRERLDSIRE